MGLNFVTDEEEVSFSVLQEDNLFEYGFGRYFLILVEIVQKGRDELVIVRLNEDGALNEDENGLCGVFIADTDFFNKDLD